jgi:hypothetical protein
VDVVGENVPAGLFSLDIAREGEALSNFAKVAGWLLYASSYDLRKAQSRAITQLSVNSS